MAKGKVKLKIKKGLAQEESKEEVLISREQSVKLLAPSILEYIFNAFESIEKQNCDLMPDVRDLISLIIAHIVVCVVFYLYFKSALTIDIGAWLCGICC